MCFHAYLTRGVADFYMGCSYEAGVDRYGKAITNSKKYKIINNGIKADDYTFNEEKRVAMRSEFDILDHYVIGHVGRFSAVKNHNFMLDVLAELKKFNADYTMMFVGDGELRKTIELKAKNMGIADSIVFPGIGCATANIIAVKEKAGSRIFGKFRHVISPFPFVSGTMLCTQDRIVVTMRQDGWFFIVIMFHNGDLNLWLLIICIICINI